jgi:hypothetical protein
MIAVMGVNVTKSVVRASLAVVLLSPFADAQWLNHPDPNLPRLRDGKPNLSAPAPKRGGKPDLAGIWQIESTPKSVLANLFPAGVGLLPGGENGLGEDDPSKYFLNILADFKRGEEPLTPAAGQQLMQRLQGGGPKPTSLCQPQAMPVADLLPAPYKIVQTPGLTMVLYEADTVFRQIHTDGRKHPVDPQPASLGYSVGRWEGDALVVETQGFNDRAPLDAMGHGHSADMRVMERFHRRDVGHLDLQLTVEDAKTFTKPVVLNLSYRLLPDTELIEAFCTEAENDLVHFQNAK